MMYKSMKRWLVVVAVMAWPRAAEGQRDLRPLQERLGLPDPDTYVREYADGVPGRSPLIAFMECAEHGGHPSPWGERVFQGMLQLPMTRARVFELALRWTSLPEDCDDPRPSAWMRDRLGEELASNAWESDPQLVQTLTRAISESDAPENAVLLRTIAGMDGLSDDLRADAARGLVDKRAPGVRPGQPLWWEADQAVFVQLLADGALPEQYAFNRTYWLIRYRGEAFLSRVAPIVARDPTLPGAGTLIMQAAEYARTNNGPGSRAFRALILDLDQDESLPEEVKGTVRRARELLQNMGEPLQRCS